MLEMLQDNSTFEPKHKFVKVTFCFLENKEFKTKPTHVRIPLGLFSTVTTAEFNRDSSIFFAASKTVSVGETVTNLGN